MKFTTGRLTAAALLLMAALPTPALTGASIVEPSVPREPPEGFELAAWAAVSGPAKGAGEVYDRGFKLGLALTGMYTQSLGVGLDLSYSRWPSDRAADAWDEYLSDWSGGAPIFGSKVSLTGLQAGLHFRAVAQPDELKAPWIQLGVGMYRMNNRVKLPMDQLEAAGVEVLETNWDAIYYAPVLSTGVGVDFKHDSTLRLGLEAKHEWIFDSGTSQPFTSLTIGARAVFGSW